MKLALVTDTHLAPRATAFNANWHAARLWIERVRPDLVIHLGDISADGEHDPTELEAAAAEFRGLPAPLRFLPGNHDIGDRPSADALAHYRRCFGADWWSEQVAGWQLIGLNTQLLGLEHADEERQFAWLEAQIRGSDAPLCLLLHKPLPPGEDSAEPGGRYVSAAAARRLRDLCATRTLRLVICGHTHQLHQVDEGTVRHVWLPSTSFCVPEALQQRVGDKRVGVMLLHLDPGHYALTPLTPAGMQRHNLLDFPQVYPQLQGLKQRHGPAAEL